MAAAHLKAPAVGYWPADKPNCAGKIGFESGHVAQAALDRWYPHYQGARREAYRCRTCGLFHIGTATRTTELPPKKAKDQLIRREERPRP